MRMNLAMKKERNLVRNLVKNLLEFSEVIRLEIMCNW